MSPAPHETVRTSWRAGLLVALVALVAVGAWAGTFGFTTGAFDDLVERLPWSNRALAAAALAAASRCP